MNCICCKHFDNTYMTNCTLHEIIGDHSWPITVNACGRGDDSMFEPIYITPAQYKERTGERFNGAVWVLTQSSMADTGDYSLGMALMTYDEYCEKWRYNPELFKGMPLPLCVLSGKMPDPEEDFEEYPPSDDWKPEEVINDRD